MIKNIAYDGRRYFTFTSEEKERISKAVKKMHRRGGRDSVWLKRRNAYLYGFRLSGNSVVKCAKKFGISNGRVRQILYLHKSRLMKEAKRQLVLLAIDFKRCGVPHNFADSVLSLFPIPPCAKSTSLVH